MPAVALLGPRQAGKTTLALSLAETRPSVYVDLESDAGHRLADAVEAISLPELCARLRSA